MPFINPEIIPTLTSRFMPNVPQKLTTANMAQHSLQGPGQHVECSRPPATPVFAPTTPGCTSASMPSSATSTFSTASFRNAVTQITNLADARSAKRRAAEALLLVFDPWDEVTHYEWESILREVSAYSREEWKCMKEEERRSIATQVLEDCGKMELIRDTLATYKIEKEKLDGIMRDIAEEANEGIKKALAKEKRMTAGNGGEDVDGEMETSATDDSPGEAHTWL